MSKLLSEPPYPSHLIRVTSEQAADYFGHEGGAWGELMVAEHMLRHLAALEVPRIPPRIPRPHRATAPRIPGPHRVTAPRPRFGGHCSAGPEAARRVMAAALPVMAVCGPDSSALEERVRSRRRPRCAGPYSGPGKPGLWRGSGGEGRGA